MSSFSSATVGLYRESDFGGFGLSVFGKVYSKAD